MKTERIVWIIILVIAGAFLLYRASTGQLGRVYVEGTLNDFVVDYSDPDNPGGTVGKHDARVLTVDEASEEGVAIPEVGQPNRYQWWSYKEQSAKEFWQETGVIAVEPESGADPDAANSAAGEGAESAAGTGAASTPAAAAVPQMEYKLSIGRTAGLWAAALFTLAIFSFLYRDNPFYKTAESIVVGVSAAYWMVVGFWTVIIPNLVGRLLPAMVKGWSMPGIEPDFEWTYLFPLILGIMLLMRLSPKGSWISRWPLAFIIGTTAGFRMITFIHADFLSQIRNGIKPLYVPQYTDAGQVAASATFWASLENVLLLIGVLSCLVYFFFSIEHKGIVGKTAKLGIWFLMVTFGAAFGYTVMGRIALLAIRLEFLFDDWLWLIDPKDLHTLTSAATGGG